MIVRPPLVPGLQACRHDGTVHPFAPLTVEQSHRERIVLWDLPPGVCPPILWPTADPLASNGVGACGGVPARLAAERRAVATA